MEGKKTQKQQFSSPFDFGLMVQSVERIQEQQNHEREKIERLPVLEGISKYADNHVLLRGKPGSGKSTALARLLLEEAKAHLEINFQAHSQSRLKTTESSAVSQFQLTSAISQGIDYLASSVNDTKIPVLVELRYWQSSIFELIQAFLQKHDINLNLDETTIKNLLRQGKFLLLIDGVNELPSEESRRQVRLFRKEFSQTPMIFTTRDLGVGGDLGIVKKLEMQPLNEAQMREFVISYLPQKGEEMLQRLGDRLQEFGKTPLLLWMLCCLFQQTGNIPSNLGMVFRFFTQIYENNLRGDVVVTAESRRWWKSLLEHLAFVMMLGEPVTEFRVAISKGEVEEIFTKYLTEEKFDKPRDYAKCWLEDLIKHHLIQVENGDKIEFRHQLLQEYYAAEYLLRKLPDISDRKLQRDYLNLLKWTEPVALMLGLVEEEARALRVVRLALDVDLMLGARLAGEVKPEFQQQAIDYILNKKLPLLLEIELLSISRSDYVIYTLVNALDNEDNKVRSGAINALGNIGSKMALDALINALIFYKSDVRRGAANVLGKIGNDRAVDKLIKALSDSESSVRRDSAYALGEIGNTKAVQPLIDALDDYSILSTVVAALGNIGDEAAVQPLIINALGDDDKNVRAAGRVALKKINVSKAFLDALIKDLNHENWRVQSEAAYILNRIGDERILNDLIISLENESKYIRRQVIKALDRIGSKKAVIPLINIFQHEDSDIRLDIIYALQTIVSEAAVIPLINALNDENVSVRSIAASSLGRIGSKVAFDALTNLLNDEYSTVRNSAVGALGKIGGKVALTPLIKALNDKDEHVLITTVSELEKIGGKKAFDALVNAYNDNHVNAYFLNKIAHALVMI
ncbi:MAG: HEAT repeat domain-containing protein, partial [Cyanobacteria bacterium J06635_10]